MISRTFVLVLVLGFGNFAIAQDESVSKPTGDSSAAGSSDKFDPASGRSTTEKVKGAADQAVAETKQEVGKIAKQIDRDPRAQTAAAGILQPIYAVAETLAFPAFHWLAFSLMSAGVVSFLLQLALGKLVVLMRMGFSFKEIASDLVGLAISVVGLVLTTQAAAENSTFTQSPAMVISATAVGTVVGIILYLWGQSEELEAAAGRSRMKGPARK